MAVKRKKGGRVYYYYWVENYRKGGRVCQKHICYLGEFPTPYDAIKGLPERIAECRAKGENGRAAQLAARLVKLQELEKNPKTAGAFRPPPDAASLREANLLAAVARLPSDQAEAVLVRARAENLTPKQLRELVKPQRRVGPLDDRDGRIAAALDAGVLFQKLATVLLTDDRRADLSRVLEALTLLSMEPVVVADEDRASDGDVRKGVYGRRV